MSARGSTPSSITARKPMARREALDKLDKIEPCVALSRAPRLSSASDQSSSESEVSRAVPELNQRSASCHCRPYRAARGGESGTRRRSPRSLCRGEGERLRREGAPRRDPHPQAG